jgi:hypothetical protein
MRVFSSGSAALANLLRRSLVMLTVIATAVFTGSAANAHPGHSVQTLPSDGLGHFLSDAYHLVALSAVALSIVLSVAVLRFVVNSRQVRKSAPARVSSAREARSR